MSKEQERRTKQALLYNLENLHSLSTSTNLTDTNLLEMLLAFKDSYYIDEAIEVAELAVELYPYQADFYLHLAGLHFSDGNYSLALSIVNDALLINPCQCEIEVLKIRILSQLGGFQEAQSLIDELSSRLMRSEWGLLYIAQSYLCQASKEYSRMFFYSKQALVYCPESEEAFDLFGRAIELSKEFDEAINFLNDCIDEDPYSYLAWYHLALAYACTANYDRAILAYEYSFISNPDFLRAYIECAELCTELGYWRKSILVNMDIQDRFDDNADCYAQMAKCYLHLRMIDPAQKCLLDLARLDNEHEDLYFLLGDCFFVQRNWSKASMAYKKGLKTNEDHDEYIFRLARAQAKLQNQNAALDLFETAVELGPEQDEYWFGYAKYLIKLNRFDEALVIVDRAEEFTFSSKLDYLKSIVLLKCNKRKEGLEFLSAALEEDNGQLHLFYKYLPEAKDDRQIQSIVKYFA